MGAPKFPIPDNLNVFWPELASLWEDRDFGAAHDWLGERWNALIQSRPDGHADRDAQFLQGLAFAALAFHFTGNANQDGARLMADDALGVLSGFVPSWAGMEVAPVADALKGLRPLLNGIPNDAPCPMKPLRCGSLKFSGSHMTLVSQ